jgi:hypothetical protein
MMKTYRVYRTINFPADDESYDVEFMADSVDDSMPTCVYIEEWLYPPKVVFVAETLTGSALDEMVAKWKSGE